MSPCSISQPETSQRSIYSRLGRASLEREGGNNSKYSQISRKNEKFLNGNCAQFQCPRSPGTQIKDEGFDPENDRFRKRSTLEAESDNRAEAWKVRENAPVSLSACE